jgi:hypothetical protein
MDEAIRLWVLYLAADEAAKATAWRVLIRYLVLNPECFAAVCSSGSAFAFREATLVAIRAAVLKAIAERAAMSASLRIAADGLVAESITGRFIVMRVGAALAGAPKLPVPPNVQIALGLAIIIGSTGQAFAEGKSRREAGLKYQEYVADYFIHIIRIMRVHPWQLERMQPPKLFDEWYVENQ